MKIHITLVVSIPLSFLLFIYKTPSLSLSLSLSLSRFNSLEDANPSGPLAPLHGMMSFQMTSPCSVCVFVPPPPHTHHHHHHSSSFSSSCSPPSVSFLRGKVLFDTHPLYPDHRPNCLASTSGEGGRGREREGERRGDRQGLPRR